MEGRKALMSDLEMRSRECSKDDGSSIGLSRFFARIMVRILAF